MATASSDAVAKNEAEARPLGTLAPGERTLVLACQGPAIVANDVLHNGDSRALGLAVGNWRLRAALGSP